MTIRRYALLASASLMALAGCGLDSNASTVTPMTRPAERATCQELQLGGVPSDLRLVDRRLIPYGPGLSGVEATYAGAESRSIVVNSGGYFDEMTEPYDNLEQRGVQHRDGAQVSLLAGTFREHGVQIAMWRDSGTAIPCDARSVTAIDLQPTEFQTMIILST